jgi:hypothetical protein
MILCLVALPGFLIISSVSGIVKVISLNVQVALYLLIFGPVEAITIAQWVQ